MRMKKDSSNCSHYKIFIYRKWFFPLAYYRRPLRSVVDPDPLDVFGPPGFGSGSVNKMYGSGSSSRNSKKILESYCLLNSL
jgi:hypothetical protein